MRPDARMARASRARGLCAATAFACLWAAAARAQPAQDPAQDAAPRQDAQAAASVVAPQVPDGRAGEVGVQLAATGALVADLTRQAPADDAHFCATLALAGGRQDYLLRFGADPEASLLDPARPGLVLTVAGLDDVAAEEPGPRDGSIQVAIGGQTFFGSTQPGAPFRLELSLLAGRDGGRFVARHLADRSGRQVIDLAGAWRCAASPTAVAAAAGPRPAGPGVDAAPDPANSPGAGAGTAGPPAAAEPQPPAPEAGVTNAPTPAAPAATGAPEVTDAPVATNVPTLAAPAPAAPVLAAPAAPAPAEPLPAGTAFRQLLAALDHAAPTGGQAPVQAAPEPPRVAPPPGPARAVPPADPAGLVPPPPRVAQPSPEFSSRRVFIHVRAGSRRGAAVADDLARTLDPQFARTEIRTVAATPASPEIRYSHPDDAAAAAALARRLGGPGGPWRVRSFTNLSQRTMPGSLEVWVPER